MAQTQEQRVQVLLGISANQAKDELDNLTRKERLAVEELKNLKKGTDEYIKANKDLRDVKNRIAELQDALGVTGLSMKQLEASAKKLNVELKNAVLDSDEWTQAARKLKEVEDRMAELKAQAKGLGAPAQEGMGQINKSADLAGKSINELEAMLLRLKGDLKNAAPNTDVYKKLEGEIGLVEGRLGSLKGNTASVREAMNQLVPGFGVFDRGANAIKVGISATKGLTAGMNILKIAIAATGIGLLVVAVGALAGWVLKTDQGMKLLEGTMNAIGNVVDVLITRIDALIHGDLDGAFSGLGKDLKEAATAGYEQAEAMDALDEAQRRVSLTISELEVKRDQALVKAKNRTLAEKERIRLLEEASRTERQIYDLQVEESNGKIKIAQTEMARRLDLANKGLNLSKRSYAEQAAALKEYLLQRKSLNQGAVTDDDLNKLRDLYLAENELLRSKNDVEDKIQNRRDQLEEKFEEKRKARAEKIQKAQEKAKAEAEKAAQDELEVKRKIQDAELAMMEEGLAKTLTNLENKAKAEKAAVEKSKATAQTKALALQKIDQALEIERARATEEYYKKQEEKQEEAAKKELDVANRKQKALLEIDLRAASASGDRQQILAAKLAMLDYEMSVELQNKELTEQEKLNIEGKYSDLRKELREQTARELADIDQKHNMEEFQATQALFSDLAKLGQALGQRELQNQENLKNDKLKKLEAEYKAGKISKEKYEADKQQIEDEAAAQAEKTRKQLAEASRAAAIFDVLMNLFKEIAGYYATAQNVASGGVYGAVMTGIASARSAIQIAAIKAQPYATGGVVQIDPYGGRVDVGSTHAEGGINLFDMKTRKVVANIQRAERLFVFRHDMNEATKYHLNQAMYHQKAPASFAGGGVVGGDMPSVDVLNQSRVIEILEEMSENIARLPSVIKVTQNLQEVAEGLSIIQEIRERTKF